MPTVDDPAKLGLSRVGGRAPLWAYLKDVYSRRDFILTLSRFRIQAENQRNRLGILWVILKPILNAAVFGLVFGILMQSLDRTPDFIEFLVIGVFMFEFFSTSVNSGAKAITSNTALVQSLSFPRMVLPISVVLKAFLQLIPAVVVMVLIVAAMGHPPQWKWLGLIPLLAIFFVFNTGVALIFSRLTVHFRDLNNLIPYVTRFAFYTTGIFFSFDIRFEDRPTLLQIVDFQPVYVVLSLARSLMLDSDPLYTMRPEYWVTASVWAVAVFVVGVVFFWSAEERYGRTD